MSGAERLRDVLVLIILGSCYFQGWNLQGGLKQGNTCLSLLMGAFEKVKYENVHSECDLC